MDHYDYLLKFLLLGNSGVGKTSFLRRLIDGSIPGDKYITTVGVDFREKRITSRDGQRIQLQIWDTAGQERFRSITTAFFRDADGFILMFDVTDAKSMVDCRGWMSQIRAHGRHEAVDVVICGNKVDLATHNDDERSKVIAEVFGGVEYFETSAVSGLNVENAVEKLVELVVNKLNDAKKGQFRGEEEDAILGKKFKLAPNFDYSSIDDDNVLGDDDRDNSKGALKSPDKSLKLNQKSAVNLNPHCNCF